MKKLFIAIFVIVLVLGAGVGVYFYKQKNNEPVLEASLNFEFQDDENEVILNEEMEITPEMKQIYEDRIKDAEANILLGGDDDFQMTNYSNLALNKKYLGEYEASFNAYLKALELDPRFRTGWLALVDLLIDMEAYETAQSAMDKAMDVNKYESINYIKQANLYKVTSKPKEDVYATYDAGIEITGGTTMLYDAYAEYAKRNKDYEKAILMYEKVKKAEPLNTEAIDRKIEKIKSKM